MTKPREKTREELQAEIEDGKKKIRQFENREKMLRQKLSKRGTQNAQPPPYCPGARSFEKHCAGSKEHD